MIQAIDTRQGPLTSPSHSLPSPPATARKEILSLP